MAGPGPQWNDIFNHKVEGPIPCALTLDIFRSALHLGRDQSSLVRTIGQLVDLTTSGFDKGSWH